MMDPKRVCRRCLLRELDGSYFESVYKYIASIPEEQKTSPDRYALRLEKCKICGYMQNGMCTQCGCFVEVRAAKRSQRCPMDAWGPEESAQADHFYKHA